ncbi:MAG TPA: alpha/beta fold hydrolase [bacterium]|nr:alpha/beta fold hydrolase [bacterium]
MLHFHGNGDLAHNWVDWGNDVAQHTGYSVFLAEYRGYGGLPGRPTYDGVMNDARATLAFLEERYGLSPSEIVLYGHSLGTGVAAQLAAEQGARAVLLESPLTSIVAAGQRSFIPPFSYVVPYISRIHWAPVDDVRKIQAPVWVACGDCDEVCPASMSEEVYAAALHQGEYLLVPQAEHGNVVDIGGDDYWAWLIRALN